MKNKRERDVHMKEKTKLRVIQILCIVSLLITFFSIQRTYAKYYEQVGTTYATNIRRWVINVNESIIHEETTLSNIMTPKFFYNEHMSVNENLNNILVPGREGCFDFLIDYTQVDLPFKFSFDIKQLNVATEGGTQVDAHLEDFEVYGYVIVDPDFSITSTTKIDDIGEITTLTKVDGKYQLSGLTQAMDPEDSEKQKRILVLFRWNDENMDTTDATEAEGMNNQEDTQFTGEENGSDLHDLLKYNVKITFTQIV